MSESIDEITWLNELQQRTMPTGIVGPGDDCAMFVHSDKTWLVTTDSLVEHVHFQIDWQTSEKLGYKLAMVNLSDIAAMGGIPRFIWFNASLPHTTEYEWLRQVYAGLQKACQQWNVFILGGDTTGSRADIFLNVTAIGESTKEIKFRNLAQPGDMICIVGNLGHARAGLEIIKKQKNGFPSLVKSFLEPQALVEQGQYLAEFSEVSAMMDISDGLYSDIQKICSASQVAAEIELTNIPVSEDLVAYCQDDQLARQYALVGGEDYALLVTISPEHYDAVRSQFEERFKQKLIALGTIKEGSALRLTYQKQPFKPNELPFDHFNLD